MPTLWIWGWFRDIPSLLDALHKVPVVRVKVVVVVEEIKLRIVGLPGLDDYLHLRILFGDE